MLVRLTELFKSTFAPEKILKLAREFGAVQRLRSIHPADFCNALVGCSMGDEERSIASARRLYGQIAGYAPEESSFYDRFNAGMGRLMKTLYEQALEAATDEGRAAVAIVLNELKLKDILAIDGSQVLLPKSASVVLPSTSKEHGGFKVTATLSVAYQALRRIDVTDARTHDRKALKLDRWLHNQLLLLDRGYCDHRLFADIEARKGFFLTPLKATSIPTIAKIRCGLGQRHVGKELLDDLPYNGDLDIDAMFSIRGGRPKSFRVVGVSVLHEMEDGSSEYVDIWLVTNLPPELVSAEQLATLYRLRWDVEILFKILKSVARMDQIRSANKDVIDAFLYAALLGLVLAQGICADMRRKRPDIEPSFYRVTALVLGYLPKFLSASTAREFRNVVERFEQALWREGVNPNPGRPYAATQYAHEFSGAA